jgi:hypothetical protein
LKSDSPDYRKERENYNKDKHMPIEILQALFRSLHRGEEKLSFAVLKLFDLILEKCGPSSLDHLFINSIQRTVSKSLQNYNSNQQLI